MGREIFGAVIRLGALYLLFLGLADLLHVATSALNIDMGAHYPLSSYAFGAVFYLALGALIFTGASRIERVAYGSEKS